MFTSHILIDLSREADTKYGPGFPPLLAPYNQENQTIKSARYLTTVGQLKCLTLQPFAQICHEHILLNLIFEDFLFIERSPIINAILQYGNEHLIKHHINCCTLLLKLLKEMENSSK